MTSLPALHFLRVLSVSVPCVRGGGGVFVRFGKGVREGAGGGGAGVDDWCVALSCQCVLRFGSPNLMCVQHDVSSKYAYCSVAERQQDPALTRI